MHKRKLVILAGKGISTNILYHSLKDDYYIEKIILEEPVSRKEFIKKRIKKLGLWKVIGQVLFQFVIVKYLNLISAKRKKEILQNYHLNDAPLPSEMIINLKSVNDNQCLLLLQKMKPELVVVNGTRIISKEILNSTPVQFINIHAGITPKYRNVHGAYWALVNNDAENCGVTVHLVDPGIDTGKIIYQQRISITKADNFVTYPLLQLAEGIIVLKKALEDIFNGNLVIIEGTRESKIWHHPSLWQYLSQRVFFNKK